MLETWTWQHSLWQTLTWVTKANGSNEDAITNSTSATISDRPILECNLELRTSVVTYQAGCEVSYPQRSVRGRRKGFRTT